MTFDEQQIARQLGVTIGHLDQLRAEIGAIILRDAEPQRERKAATR